MDALARKVASRYKTADVTKTIIQQMGGGRLKMMLGANLIRITNGLGIKWPNKQRSKGNYVEVVLRGDDTYDMTFYNLSVRGKKKVKAFNGVYADQLVELFEKQTGWYLRLARTKTADRWDQATRWFDSEMEKLLQRAWSGLKKDLAPQVEKLLEQAAKKGEVGLKDGRSGAQDALDRVLQDDESPQWDGWPADNFWLNSFYYFDR
jgi:hypothetical protein